MKNNHNKYYVYILAGAYLVYLAYQMAQELFSGAENGYAVIWLGIATVIFAICGLSLALWSFRKEFLHQKTRDKNSLPAGTNRQNR